MTVLAGIVVVLFTLAILLTLAVLILFKDAGA